MTMTIRPRAGWLALVAAVTVMGCNKKADEGKLPLAANAEMPKDSVHAGMVAPKAPEPEMSPAARAALDSGNALQRKKMYAEALVQYRRSGTLAPGSTAPAFGVYMAARATNNTVLADSALAVIKERNAVEPHGNIDTSAVNAAHRTAGAKPLTKT